MPRKNIILTPNTVKILEKMGAQIKKARLRRNKGVYGKIKDNEEKK